MTEPVPGTFCLVLHSHLPWLPGHGVWPVGEEWLHQAWLEAYVPLVEQLDTLAEAGHRELLTLGVTPVLAAQLDHPTMLTDAGTWAALAELRAREMGFDSSPERRVVAEYDYAQAHRGRQLLESRWAGGGSPVLRSLRDAGVVELLGGPTAHPLLPLLLPEVADAALGTGLEDSLWRLGERPRGIWSPECGTAPGLATRFDRAGVGHFVVDEQTVRDAGGHSHAAWRVAGTEVIAVPRDLEVTNLIWSSRRGYPGAAAYRDFHAREPFTGIRLWAITAPDVDVAAKTAYDPAAARAQVAHDVEHFVAAVRRRLAGAFERTGIPALAVAAYDTELFGHWWHEGPQFLAAVLPALRAAGVTVTTVERALERGHVAGELDLGPGSWGAGKDFSVWDGPAAAGIAEANLVVQRRWVALMAAERSAGRLVTRRADLDQLMRTMILGLSSDWAFLVTRGQSADYAQRRAAEHHRDFHALASLVEAGLTAEAAAETARQAARDNPFPALDARLPRPARS